MGVVDEPRRVGQLAAIVSLDRQSGARLRTLLTHHPDVDEAWAVAAGRLRPHPGVEPLINGSVGAAWRAAADGLDVDALTRRCAASGIGATVIGDQRYPGVLVHDPQPPAVLFHRGSWDALTQRRVGVVGTRNATGPGRRFARELGADLAAAGVGVVSGLAKGIDGAAHGGALADGTATTRPIGVVANGLDVAYPRCNAELWEAVAERGLLLSEWPPGVAPERFRFPLRNRILAALSEVLVVVESRARGGSLTTAREALQRGIDVLAVPGAVSSPASAGTNHLLRDGAAPVLGADDVLVALGLDHQRSGNADGYDPRPLPRGLDAQLLDRCRAAPCTLDTIIDEFHLEFREAVAAMSRLERTGWVCGDSGFYEELGR